MIQRMLKDQLSKVSINKFYQKIDKLIEKIENNKVSNKASYKMIQKKNPEQNSVYLELEDSEKFNFNFSNNDNFETVQKKIQDIEIRETENLSLTEKII